MGSAQSKAVSAGWIIREFTEHPDTECTMIKQQKSYIKDSNKSPLLTENSINNVPDSRNREYPDHISHCGIELYTDMIVSINMNPVSEFFEEFAKALNEKDVCSLVIYSLRNKSYRMTRICRSLHNSQTIKSQPITLGCKVIYSTIEEAEQNIHHVIDVNPDGIGAKAGLEPLNDYIISYYKPIPNGSIDLSTYIAQNMEKMVSFVVYNSERDEMRIVDIIPSKTYSNSRPLGCIFGNGLAHQLPKRQIDTNSVQSMNYIEQRLISAKFIFPSSKPYDTNENQNNNEYESIIAAYEYHFKMAENLSKQLKSLTVKQMENSSLKVEEKNNQQQETNENQPKFDPDHILIENQKASNPNIHYGYKFIRDEDQQDNLKLDKKTVDSMTIDALKSICNKNVNETQNTSNLDHINKDDIPNIDSKSAFLNNEYEKAMFENFNTQFPWFCDYQIDPDQMTIYPLAIEAEFDKENHFQ